MRISDWSSDVCSSDLFASNHVGRDRPRTSGKTQHGDLRIERHAAQPHRLVDWIEAPWPRHKTAERGVEQPWRKLRPLTVQKFQPLAHRMGDDPDIGKQDRPIKADSADR